MDRGGNQRSKWRPDYGGLWVGNIFADDRGIARFLLDGLPADEVLATPGEFTSQLGLQDLVSPLRLRGMAALLARIKRQIRDQRG